MSKLYFYYSSMNAGKTTSLLQSSYNYQERGMKTLIYAPSIDDRFDKGMVSSRIGLQAPAILFEAETDLLEDVRQHLESTPYDCVMVDEAQFLNKKQVFQLSEIVDQLQVPVLAYGLRTDFQGEPFEGSKYLLAWADNLNEIKAICSCGRKATMVVRMNEKGQAVTQGHQIEIGGNDRYVSFCRKCFKTATDGAHRQK
ncbi:MAG: thymidine kinase [Verrucomicrobiota bacterium]